MDWIRIPVWRARIALLLLALVGYGLTMARTVSFWDCGEFIAAAHVLGIPHPPGTPLFVLLGRVWDIVLGPWMGTAMAINALSAVATALLALLVLEVTVRLLRGWKLAAGMRAVLGFLAGSLTLFSDTIWFNAVEAEVYGLAMLWVLLEIWVLLRWDESQRANRNRWLVLFVYLSFLGTGLHTYSMLVLPVAWLFVGFRLKYWRPERTTGALIIAMLGAVLCFFLYPWWFGFSWAMLVWGTVVLTICIWGFYRREWTNLWFWLTGLFLMSSVFWLTFFLAALAVALPVLGIFWFYRRCTRRSIRTAGLLFCLLLMAGVGYSVQLFLPIRSAVNPVMDENNPETWEAFLALLERRQYGSMGMLERAFYRRGHIVNQLGFHPRIGYLGYHLNQFWAAPEGAQVPQGSWLQNGHRVAGELLLVAVLVVLWVRRRHPRVWMVAGLFGLSSLGLLFYVNFADGSRPDSSWAANWYARMHQLQNEVEQKLPALPALTEITPALRYYSSLEPHLRASWLNTEQGYPIRILMEWENVVTKNGRSLPMPPGPVHLEVRERDYFYSPAFVLYAILVALALGHLSTLTKSNRLHQCAMIVAALAWLIPFLTHYKTHDRSGDQVARDFAYNTLSSVPQNGILITYGDNDTFPLWYMQMVEKFRTDVIVINHSLAGMDWYRREILRRNPQLHLKMDPDSVGVLAYRKQPSPAVVFQGEPRLLRHLPTWRPREDQLFIYELIAANWPQVPVTFMYSADPEEMGEMRDWLPLTGLVRELGLTSQVANQQLWRNLTDVYRYTGLETGSWQYQEATERTVGSYRWLFTHALQQGGGLPGDENRLREISYRLVR